MKCSTLLAVLLVLFVGAPAWAGPMDLYEDDRLRKHAPGQKLSCPEGTNLVVQDGRAGSEELCLNADGERHGYYLVWHKDGKNWAVFGNYARGNKHGRWLEFNNDGHLTQVLIYEKGVLRQRRAVKVPKADPGA